MRRSLGRARHALRSRDFRFLLGGRLVSQFADGIFQAYLIDRVVFLSAESGTAAAAAQAFALLVIPLACGPVSALRASRIRAALRPGRSTGRLGAELRRVTRELGRGARRLVATPSAFGSIVSISFDQFLIGLITVLSVVVFKNEFKQGVASYGRIVGAGGVGVLIGSATVGWFEGRLAKPRVMSLAFALAGAPCLIGSIRIASPTILLISFTLDLTYPWRKVPADTLVQHSIPDRFRGRVFALYDMAFSLPRVIAAALAIPLFSRLSSRLIVALVGLAYLAWTPVPLWWVRRPRWVDLRFYAGARADEVPRSMVIAGDEEPIEVVASSFEEAADGTVPVRTRRLRLRTSDGSIL